MNNLFRGLLAGVGLQNLAAGDLGTILVFAIIWALLGTCDGGSHAYIRKSSLPAITECGSGATTKPISVFPTMATVN